MKHCCCKYKCICVFWANKKLEGFKMLFLFFSKIVSLSYLSVDLGSESMRASILERGNPVRIVLNSLGKRFSPSVSLLRPICSNPPAFMTHEDVDCFERITGDDSFITKYPDHVMRFLPQILGKNYSKKLVKFFEDKKLRIAFDSDEDKYMEVILPPEFYASNLIQLAINDFKNSKINATVDELNIVVPKFLTHHQRTAFIRAGKLSTFKPHLIDTSEALGTLFAVEKSQLFNGNDLVVCFVDIGASQIQVSIQGFEKNEGNIKISELGYAWNDQFGSYLIDLKIADKIKNKILKQKPDVLFDEKSEQKIIRAGRKIKHELTLQPNVTLFLEDLVHGFDMEFTYSLKQLKELCKNEIYIINRTIIQAFNQSGFSNYKSIDRVELIGGGSRSPLFIEAINNIFNRKVPILRSLNSEEASVIGTGYVIAAKKGGFIKSNIIYEGLPAYKISVIKNDKYATFIYSDSQKLPFGIKQYIRTIGLLDDGDYENYEGRVKIVGYHKFSTSGLDKNKRNNIEKILRAFEEKEEKQRKRNKVLHDFETFLIDTREKVTMNPSIIETSTQEERTKILHLIALAQYRVQNESNINEEELQNMQMEIEFNSKDLIKRGKNLEMAPEAYDRLSELLDDINDAYEKEWPRLGLKPPKKLLRRLGRSCSKAEKYLNEHENMKNISYDEISLLLERLKNEYENVKIHLKRKNNEL